VEVEDEAYGGGEMAEFIHGGTRENMHPSRVAEWHFRVSFAESEYPVAESLHLALVPCCLTLVGPVRLYVCQRDKQ
jgi:hypothetical protein